MSRALDFYIDFEWKPEPEEEGGSSGNLPRSNSSGSPLALGVSRRPYKGALTIIEYQCDPLKIEVIRDIDKVKMRFPFGGVVPTDPTPINGSRRETKEEVGLGLGRFTEKNFVCELSGGPNCTIYVFAKRLRPELRHKVVLGEEQRDHVAMLITTVDRYVDRGLISYNHANAWLEFKRWRTGKSY